MGMTLRCPVLVIAGGPHGADLISRLRAIDVPPIPVPDFEEAKRALADSREIVSAALVPVERADSGLKAELKSLRRVGPVSGLTFLAYGVAPDRDARKLLRSAGVELALWEPYDDGSLRFQINRALSGDRDEHGRRARRVPTFLLARVLSGSRPKDAVVYSLSETGCFLETPRASMDGAQIQVELRLPGRTLQVPGRVIFANVPGNLKRPNLPLGMGVHFQGIERDQQKWLAEYIEGRLRELEV